jgi:hypothetical protein
LTPAKDAAEAATWVHHITQASQEIPFSHKLQAAYPLAVVPPRAAVSYQDDWSFLKIGEYIFAKTEPITAKYGIA